MRLLWLLFIALLCLASSVTLAAMPAVKVEIKASGFYSISQADLFAQGIDTTKISVPNLTLRHKDQAIAIRVIGGSTFEPGDQIIFYAEGIAWDDPLSALTYTNVYWLEESNLPGKRMIVGDAAPGAGSSPLLNVVTTDHIEHDSVYYPGRNYPLAAERWFMAGPVHENETVSLDFTLTQNLDAAQAATITVYYQGHTDTVENPDHHSRVTINGCVLSDGQFWNGLDAFAQQESIPVGCLVAGNNTLTLYNVGDTGAIVDSWMVDSFDVQYRQNSQALQDVITFTAQPPLTVGGFSTSAVDVYAISDAANVRYLSNPVIAGVAGDFQLRFDDPGRMSTDERYQVLSVDQYQVPAGLVVDRSSSLKTTAHNVDYIMISHPALIDSLQPLAEHRRSEGLRVEVVDVTDIYDEFSSGLQTDQAIKDFLSYAYHSWQVKPAYVLLVGDATVNFKNIFSDNVPTYVPTHFYPAFDGSMEPSDTWFVTVAGDDPLPDMYIGRLPVTPVNVSVVVQKIINYDHPSADKVWMNQALFVADDDDPVFESVSNEIASILSPQYTINKVYLGQVNQDRFSLNLIVDKRNAIINNLKNGNVITAYTGHGSTGQWAVEGLLLSDDVDRASNPDRLTFMVALNCLSGYFVQPTDAATNKLSLAESFVTSTKGGAVAAWAASYLGFTSDHRVMAEKLFGSIKQQGSQRLGAVTTQARIQALSAGANEDTLDSYIFFGDPATALASQRVISDGGGGGGALWLLSLLILLRGLVTVSFQYRS